MEPTILIIGIVVMIILIILTVALLLLYSGVFHQVEIGAGKPPVQELYVAYKFRKGAYKNAGEIFTEITHTAPDQRNIGIYYDDPAEVAEHKLRYIVGCILAEGPERPDKTLADKFEKMNYKFAHFPATTNAVKTTFPYTTTISILIAISRVYPKLAAYVREKRLCAHPIMEIYDGAVIHFMAPLARQDEFYVREYDADYVEPAEQPEVKPIPEEKEAGQGEGSLLLKRPVQVPIVDQGQGDAPIKKSTDSNVKDTQEVKPDGGAVDKETPVDKKALKIEIKPADSSVSEGGDTSSTPQQVITPTGSDNSNDAASDKSSGSSFEEVPMDLEELK